MTAKHSLFWQVLIIGGATAMSGCLAHRNADQVTAEATSYRPVNVSMNDAPRMRLDRAVETSSRVADERGPEILCDEYGPRAIFVSHADHKLSHAEEFGFTASPPSRSGASVSQAGYLKTSLDD